MITWYFYLIVCSFSSQNIYPHIFMFEVVQLSQFFFFAQGNYGVYFVLANYAWARDLPWSVVANTQRHSTEKADLPFDSGHQLQIASWLRVELCVRFPLFVLRLLSGLNLYRFLSLLSVFVSSCVTCSDVSRSFCFLEVIHHQNKGIKTNHLPCPLEASVLTASLSLVKGLRGDSLQVFSLQARLPGVTGTPAQAQNLRPTTCPACKTCWGHRGAELVGATNR